MRVTRDSLLRIAKETAQERAYNDPDIIAAYLTGSLLSPEPMLGGTADIDITFVHKSTPLKTREFVKLTPDFHLDIARRAKDEFKAPRELRGDPWLGYEMYAPMLLYEREKFFDFVQASLRAGFEFEQPPLTLQRCRTLLSHGRGNWMDLSEFDGTPGPKQIRKYMKAVFHAGNAIVELAGSPIWERRFLFELPARAESAGHPEIVATIYNLIGATNVNVEKVKEWLADWKSALRVASETPGVDARIHPARLNYYEKSIKALLEGDTPLSALWPLLHTWTLSANVLSGDHLKFWQTACTELGLLESFADKINILDNFLDQIEITFEEFATANGLEVEPPTGL